MAESDAATMTRPLAGEDPNTLHWEDARHWLSIYGDLIRFKRGLLDRINRDLVKLPEPAREAASVDLGIIQAQMDGYHHRLDLWYRRVWELQGMVLDPGERTLRHMGAETRLTNRESQLLKFLLDHPHRFYTPDQITSGAWSDPALLPEEVRNYVLRLRRILARLAIPCDLVNRPGRGYSLVFRAGE